MSQAPVIAVLDYGAGNLRSVAKALLRSGLDARVTCDPSEVASADAVVLPGVGAFAEAALRLRESGLEDAVKQSIEQAKDSKKPLTRVKGAASKSKSKSKTKTRTKAKTKAKAKSASRKRKTA